MINRYRVSMDNHQLDQVDDRIWILDITEPDPGISFAVEQKAIRDGAVITRKHRDKCSVTVKFCINAYDTAVRSMIYQNVVRWARGNVLRCNTRYGQALYHAVLEGISPISAKNWTEELTLTFSDYTFPYWQDEEIITKTLAAGTNKSGTMTVPGNAENTVVNASITAGASVSWVKVYAGDTMIYLSEISLSNGDVVTIDHDDGMNLRIMKGTTSLLNKRTADSDDDLIVNCNTTTTVRVQASGSVTGSFTARGCWV